MRVIFALLFVRIKFFTLNIFTISGKDPYFYAESFERTFEVQKEFDFLDKLNGSRVQEQRMQLLHRKSRILCWIQFGVDFEVAETSQAIRNAITFEPLCKLFYSLWNY